MGPQCQETQTSCCLFQPCIIISEPERHHHRHFKTCVEPILRHQPCPSDQALDTNHNGELPQHRSDVNKTSAGRPESLVLAPHMIRQPAAASLLARNLERRIPRQTAISPIPLAKKAKKAAFSRRIQQACARNQHFSHLSKEENTTKRWLLTSLTLRPRPTTRRHLPCSTSAATVAVPSTLWATCCEHADRTPRWLRSKSWRRALEATVSNASFPGACRASGDRRWPECAFMLTCAPPPNS